MTEQRSKAPYLTLIHLGCGAKPTLENYLNLAEQVWLVDADGDVIQELQDKLAETPNLHLRQEIIALDEQPATFYHYNLAWANGLQPIDEATQRLYPGLHCLKTSQQLTQPIGKLVEQIIKKEAKHLLILDLGEQNQAVLQAMEDTGQLALFTQVILMPAHNSKAVTEVPHSLHRTTQANEGLALPENSQVLERHPLVQQLQNTQQEHLKEQEALKQQLAELKQDRDSQAKKLEEAAQQREEQAKKTESLNKEQEALKQQLAEIKQDRDSKAKKLEEATQKSENLVTQIEIINKEKEDALHQKHLNFEAKNAAQLEVEQLTQKCEELKKTVESLTEEKATFLQQQDQLINQTQEERKQWLAKLQTQEHLEQNLVRVEAQLDLLKQLLIHEQEL